MKIANVYQQIESKGSIIVNWLNFLVGAGSGSFEIVRTVDGEKARDLFGRFPFGRLLLLWSWFDGSADAERSLGVSREIDDGIWWMLNAGLIWSISRDRVVLCKNMIEAAESKLVLILDYFLCFSSMQAKKKKKLKTVEKTD